jgi:hypothetical protein
MPGPLLRRLPAFRAVPLARILLVTAVVGCDAHDALGPAPLPEEPVPPAVVAAEIPLWPHFASFGDFMYEAANPPNGDPGIWLGDFFTPDMCFADRHWSVSAYRDADRDWLADDCELELARAFAPLMHFWAEPCPGGEPVWAAKYFARTQHVRIAYMPAYYDDCGRPHIGFIGGGHAGDTELIVVEVRYNVIVRRWQYQRMWMSAHHGASTDGSEWAHAQETQFSLRYLGHPSVWVAVRKHANYKSIQVCQSSSALDTCQTTNETLRFPVHPGRNIGSRHVYLVDCVLSTGRFLGNGVRECFWTGRPDLRFNGYWWTYVPSFGGWHPSNDLFGDQPGPYGPKLVSRQFEQRCTWFIENGPDFYYRCGSGDDWGPGPNPPAPPSSNPPPPPPPPPGECADPTQIICTV